LRDDGDVNDVKDDIGLSLNDDLFVPVYRNGSVTASMQVGVKSSHRDARGARDQIIDILNDDLARGPMSIFADYVHANFTVMRPRGLYMLDILKERVYNLSNQLNKLYYLFMSSLLSNKLCVGSMLKNFSLNNGFSAAFGRSPECFVYLFVVC